MGRIRRDSRNQLTLRLEKRKIHRNQTAFLLVVAFGAVLLFMTSRMIKNEKRGVKYSLKVGREFNVFKYKSQDRIYEQNVPNYSPMETEDVYVKSGPNVDTVNLNKHRTLLSNNEDPKRQCEATSLDLVILIFSKSTMTELRNSIRKTWCKKNIFPNDQKMTCMFLIGQAETGVNDRKLKDEISEHGDLIMTSYTFSRRNSSVMLLEGIEWLMTNCVDVRYVLRAADDVIINVEHLVTHILPGIPDKNFVGGRCKSQLANRNPESSFYVSYDDYENEQLPITCLNIGYIMSGDVISMIQTVSKGREFVVPLDDIYIGILLHEKNVTPQNLDNFLLTKSTEKFGRNYCSYSMLHIHYNTEGKNREIWPIMKAMCNNS